MKAEQTTSINSIYENRAMTESLSVTSLVSQFSDITKLIYS